MVLERKALSSITAIVSLAAKLLLLLPLIHPRLYGGGAGVACPVALSMLALNRVVIIARGPPLGGRGVDGWVRIKTPKTAHRGYRVLR